MADEPEAKEQYLSRNVTITEDNIEVETTWFIFNTDNPFTAASLLPKVGYAYEQDGQIYNTRVSEVEISPTENQSPLTQIATVTYNTPQPGSSGNRQNKATWSLTINTETANVKKARSQQNFPAQPNYLNINETDDGIEGVDILSASSALKINHYLGKQDATPAYFDSIQKNLVAKTNAAPFIGPWGNWAAGEVLYIGFDISFQDDLFQVSHQFKRSVNGNVDVKFQTEDGKPDTKNVLKKGWEHFWTLFKPIPVEVDGNVFETKTGPFSGHIAEVYKSANFGLLNLPDEFFPEGEL